MWAVIHVQKNAWHSSKQEGAEGLVRATNGRHFNMSILDESNPRVLVHKNQYKRTNNVQHLKKGS